MSAMQRAVPQTDLAGDNPNEKLPVVQKRAITSMKVDLDRYRFCLVRLYSGRTKLPESRQITVEGGDSDTRQVTDQP